MNTHYNAIAGRSVERLAALSDGLFAVAMTLLVLDLHVPVSDAVHSEAELRQALVPLAPQLLVYCMSFLTLGIFWVGQQAQLNQLTHSNRNLTWIFLAFLFAVTLMPFSTTLMARFIEYRAALLIYWGNIVLLGFLLLACWRYAQQSGLVKSEVPVGSIERRIVIAQALYAFGALLCVVNTYWSIGFIVMVQLNYAIAPRIGWLQRL